MVFEDLHCADPGLLDFIDHVLEWSRALAASLIVTLARPNCSRSGPTGAPASAASLSIYLEPLPDDGDARAARRARAGAAAEGNRDAIVARADGIPLYAVETVRMLLGAGPARAGGRRLRAAGDLDDSPCRRR